jgi:HSP20 family protein
MRDLVSLRDAMGRLHDETYAPPRRLERSERQPARLPVDVYSTDNEIVIVAAVPGLTPDEVSITLEAETLSIRGELKPPIENVNYELQERYYGPFSRTFTINVPVDTDHVEATFENGLLTLVLPKAEEVKPKTIKVTAK